MAEGGGCDYSEGGWAAKFSLKEVLLELAL